MKPLVKGLVLAAIQLALIAGIGAKLLYERATRPRVWVWCQTYDPDLPIRGRYLSESLRIPAEGFSIPAANPNQRNQNFFSNRAWAYFEIRNGQLMAVPQGEGSGGWVYLSRKGDAIEARVEEPVLVFIPDTSSGPILHRGEELWVEVTLPKVGPPRPIQMGIKKDGTITPVKIE